MALVVAAVGAMYWFLSGDGIRQALEQQAGAWLGQPVRIGRASARVFPRVGLSLADVTVGEPASLTFGRVSVSADLRALIGRRIEQAEIEVSGGRLQMPLPTAPAASSPAEPSTDAGVHVVSVRSIALRDVRLVSRGREIAVSGDSSLEGSRLTIRRLEATGGATRLRAQGIVELAPRIDATVRLTGDAVDVDELLALAEAFAPPPAKARRSGRPAPRIRARVSVERATAGGVEVRQFATEMEVDGNSASLSPLTFQLFGGRYQGTLTARLGGQLQVTLRSRILDLDVAQLAAFGGVPEAVTGTMTAAGNFAGHGSDMASVLGSVRGEGTAAIVKGSIKRLNLIRSVVLFFGRPEPNAAPGSDAFDRMDASFSVADGLFRASALALRSPDADIVGSGTLAVVTGALDGQFDLSLSEALSAQAGTDLRRYTREGNRIVLPARLGGELGAPSLRIDAGAAVKRGLRNEVQRRLGGLLDRVKP